MKTTRKTTTKNAKTSVPAILTSRIVARMEETQQVPWTQPWKALQPYAYDSKKPFNLVNSMLLDCEGGYITIANARKKGWILKEGSHSEAIYQKYFKQFEVVDKEGKPKLDDNGNPKKRDYFYMTYTYEFPIACFTDESGNDIAQSMNDNPYHDIDAESVIDNYFKHHDIKLKRSNNYKQAFFSPRTKEVCVPNAKRFNNKQQYYSTLFHEMIHSTGIELKRDITNEFGSSKYAYEELVAECGAWILRGYCNVNDDNAERNSATYLNGWIKYLKNNENAIYNAMANAQKAVENILEGYEKPTKKEDKKVVENTTFLTPTQKRGLKKMLTSCKKIARFSKVDDKPILSKYDLQEINGKTYNVITDSYCLYATHSDISEFFEKDTNNEYPTIKKLIPTITESYKKVSVNTLDIKDIKARAKYSLYGKHEKDAIIKLDKGVHLQAKRLLTIIECMNYTHDNVTIYYLPNQLKPLLVFNEKTDDIGVVLPVRVYKD